MSQTRSYSELSRLETFEERFQYLRLDGSVGVTTFGFDRWLNQRFYKSPEWRMARNTVVLRDNGCDLGVPGHEIYGGLYIHHMNPIDLTDIVHKESWILDPEYLISTTQRTHNDIHYGRESQVPEVVLSRSPSDTKLW